MIPKSYFEKEMWYKLYIYLNILQLFRQICDALINCRNFLIILCLFVHFFLIFRSSIICHCSIHTFNIFFLTISQFVLFYFLRCLKACKKKFWNKFAILLKINRKTIDENTFIINPDVISVLINLPVSFSYDPNFNISYLTHVRYLT